MIEIQTDKPFEVKITQKHIEIVCLATFEDRTEQPIPVSSLTIKGAQREVTASLCKLGYEAVRRWISSEDHRETMRRFRPFPELKHKNENSIS